MSNASVQINVYYTANTAVTGINPVVTISSLDFCSISTTFTCPLQAVSNILTWQYTVPNILPGTYQIIYTIVEDNPPDGNPYSCIQFPITIAGPTAATFTSEYSASLLGTAVFTEDDYTQRQIGQSVQVGPAGPLNYSALGYGTIRNLAGSGDLVPNSFYDTTHFVWGLYGTMIKQQIGSNGQQTHIYSGTCYLGYINPSTSTLGNYYDYNSPLLEGSFVLNWTYVDSSTAQINGVANFDPPANIPLGWGFPLLYGRLGTHQVVTSSVGFLMIQASLPFCPNGLCASPPPSSGGGGGHGLSSGKLGMAIGIPIAVVFVIVLVAAALFYMKRRRETEQEDGIFAVARKPEYGSALVVDDIIEESRGSRTLQAMIDLNQGNDDGNDDESGSESESDRSRSRTPQSRSRSASPSMSRSRSRSDSRSRSRGVRSGQESDPGESASRGSDSE